MKYLLPFLILLIVGHAGFTQQNSLAFFIQRAEENSPLLKEYNNQLLSFRFDSLIYRAALRTQVNFISSNSYAPVIKGYGYDEAISNGANISSVIQATRNFVTRNNAATQIAAINLQSRGLSDTITITSQDLRRAVIDQYITTFSDQVAMDFNEEVYNLLQNEERALKKLTQASVYKQADYLAFYTTMQQQQFVFLQSRIQYNTDYLTLNYLSGIVDTAISRIERPTLSDAMPFDFAESVFYRRFTTDSLRFAVEKSIIHYEYKPRIGAYTDVGYMSSLVYTPYRNFGLSLGVSVTVPIYDGRQKRYRLSQVDLRERTRMNNKLFFVSQYRQQIAILRQQLHASDQLVATINEQLKFLNTLLTANAKLLQTGDISVADYVLAINNYINARNILNQNYINRLRILNQINYWNR